MKILLTGVTGYIGGRLLPVLLDAGHEVYACVRDRNRFPQGYEAYENLHVTEIDFLNPGNTSIPYEIDVAYYLIHSMTDSINHFELKEEIQANNFVVYMNATSVKQVVYLSGITADTDLSQHLSSRKRVGEILAQGHYHLTILRAAIIVGAGSASFEIMYDLVDKLPLMIGPKTLNNLCQPIAVKNVILYLKGILLNPAVYDQSFDIGGPDVLTYKEMLLGIADVRGLKRRIITIPGISARISAHWFYFITSTSYKLAVNLSDSMKNKVICRENRILQIIPQQLLTYPEMVELALQRLESDNVLTSWKDSFSSTGLNYKIADFWKVPVHGVLTYQVERKVGVSREEVISRIWETGGSKGWWYANGLWRLRAWLDLFGKGVGMRGRTNRERLMPGDALDFWRVLIADKERGRLLLFAEMIMPGQGWLDFRLSEKDGHLYLLQKATFRPHGWKGRLYWLTTMPFHHFIFNGMIQKLTD